ncbi:uracil-DNA glycosylase [Cervid alphaherpesvirus 2]|uniref:Uracil-DNA glycosylase n=1 Tax=Cervid alphaherpesvirus 2 TaxID=365327 RepID=A0A455JIW7_9ALPH|nr:uracil-DNA glycosylase [Cervid alphaherpesvirus 2]AVT50779.1 uracil-DNA glycosylase [Cervid alphaherpesvirus 2]
MAASGHEAPALVEASAAVLKALAAAVEEAPAVCAAAAAEARAAVEEAPVVCVAAAAAGPAVLEAPLAPAVLEAPSAPADAEAPPPPARRDSLLPPAKRRRPNGLPACVTTLEDQRAVPWPAFAADFGVPEAWRRVLEPELAMPYARHALREYERRCRVERVLPPKADVFAWTRHAAPEEIKVVILGQDPYHGCGQAHGLAFSVNRGVPVPPSLQNIYAAVQRNFPGTPRPRHGCLESWARRGVLLLNTSLTVRSGAPGSHAALGWSRLVHGVLARLSAEGPPLVFMLWGAHAQRAFGAAGKRHLVLTYSHPSPLSRVPFVECTHFAEANAFLEQQGRGGVDWSVV